MQIEGKTRLEIFLHCNHPEILDKLSGDLEKDAEVWEEMEEMYERPKTRITSSSSEDILKGRKPVGGYIPHQEDEDILKIQVDYSGPQVVNGTSKQGQNSFEQLRHPPKYEEIDPIPPKPAQPVETTEL